MLFLFVSSLLAVVAYKFIPVYYTPLMFIRVYEQVRDSKPIKLEHKWMPLKQIAQPLAQAIVASEDNLFLDHDGFDMIQIQKARADAEKEFMGLMTFPGSRPYLKDVVVAKNYLDEIYLLVEYYIANSKNELIKHSIKTKEQLEYSIEERIENNRDYEMLGIGYTFEHRFSIMQWIYIDRETKQIYEYDLPNERLIAFE